MSAGYTLRLALSYNSLRHTPRRLKQIMREHAIGLTRACKLTWGDVTATVTTASAAAGISLACCADAAGGSASSTYH